MAQNASYIGSGYLAVQDGSGNSYEAGALQDVSMVIEGTIREQLGANKVATLIAETEKKITLSAKYGRLSSALVDAVIGGGTVTSGAKLVAKVAKTASASSFTVATTDVGSPAGWAFVADLGLTFQASDQPLKYNSGTPAAGEYKNTGAVYTTGGTTDAVMCAFLYSVTGGFTTAFSNQAVGLATYFAVHLFQQSTQADGTIRKVGFKFPKCLLPKLDLGWKNTDFLAQGLDIRVFADPATGAIGERYEA